MSQGDGGYTRDARGEKLDKGGPLVEALGRMDTLTVEIGGVILALDQVNQPDESFLRRIQRDLMELSGRLAGCPGAGTPEQGGADTPGTKRISKNRKIHNTDGNSEDAKNSENVTAMERRLAGGLGFSGFVLPGKGPYELACHRARTAARAAERAVWALPGDSAGREAAGRYLNRLSGYLFSIIQQ